jgi:hypothetical protein
MPEEKLYLRMPGRIYERFNEMAQEKMDLIERAEEVGISAETLDHLRADEPVCEALASPRLKKRGSGFQVFVPLDLDALERLAGWVNDREKAEMRRYRDWARVAAREKRLEQARASKD